MRFLILSCHSAVNEPIARLTAKNRWDYSARHGYDLLVVRMEWEACRLGWPEVIRRNLSNYDVVLSIGSDVLFMNPHLRIEDFVRADDHVVLAREDIGEHEKGWSLINNDVMIWRNTAQAAAVLDQVIADRAVWAEYPQLWQRHLQNMLLSPDAVEEVKAAVRLVEPRVMNASNFEGTKKQSRWQMGDWIYHAVCGSNEDKYARLRYYEEMAKSAGLG